MLKPAVNTETTELIGLRKYDIHIPCEQRFYSTDFEPAWAINQQSIKILTLLRQGESKNEKWPLRLTKSTTLKNSRERLLNLRR